MARFQITHYVAATRVTHRSGFDQPIYSRLPTVLSIMVATTEFIKGYIEFK